MKQHAIMFIILLTLGNIFFQYKSEEVQANEVKVIPEEAIRLRILANSDSNQDQNIKRLIRNEVNEEITLWVDDLTSIEDARGLIKERIKKVEGIVEKVLKEGEINQSFKVEFDEVAFPTKMYGNFVYPAGDYEAILITLGDGEGANWWCVLFPPLCYLDFSNGDAVKPEAKESMEQEEVKVKSFVAESMKKLFN